MFCEIYKMENKDGLCEAEVRKNLVLAEIGEPLTLPLATLNRSCDFKREWERIQKIWHKKKVICINCDKEFSVSKGRSKCCSVECSEAYHKAYYERPEVKAKKKAQQKAYYERPEVKAQKKSYRERPEVKAKMKAYYEKNKEEILRKLKEKYKHSHKAYPTEKN